MACICVEERPHIVCQSVVIPTCMRPALRAVSRTSSRRSKEPKYVKPVSSICQTGYYLNLSMCIKGIRACSFAELAADGSGRLAYVLAWYHAPFARYGREFSCPVL